LKQISNTTKFQTLQENAAFQQHFSSILPLICLRIAKQPEVRISDQWVGTNIFFFDEKDLCSCCSLKSRLRHALPAQESCNPHSSEVVNATTLATHLLFRKKKGLKS
jgi:hypothetical protein